MGLPQQQNVEQEGNWIENVIRIYRSAKVVKGGRRFSFSALVVVGDGNGKVGLGYGKANEVPSAVEKAMKDARRQIISVPLLNGTIPYPIAAKYAACKVVLVPAAPGTGIIAGGALRGVLEAAGIHNILTKTHRTNNPKNLVKATMRGLSRLRSFETIEKLRGVKIDRPALAKANV